MKITTWIKRVFGFQKTPPEPIPAPIRTHGCAVFWSDHGHPHEIGSQICVTMTSGRIALYRMVKREQAVGVDWYWYDFEFVRYIT